MPFKILRNDLTKMKVDAIVNTANPEPIIGEGTDRAVYEAAGPHQLLEARRKIGKIGRGQAAITPAFGLDAKYIIHTVGPVWVDGRQGEDILLKSCYQESLKLADRNGCKSLAFPLISTGTYGFPRELALRIVNQVVKDFLDKDQRDMMIYLVVFDQESTRISSSLYAGLASYIDDHYVKEKEKIEYESDRSDRIPEGMPSYGRQSIGSAARDRTRDRRKKAWARKSEAVFEKNKSRETEAISWEEKEEAEFLKDQAEDWSDLYRKEEIIGMKSDDLDTSLPAYPGTDWKEKPKEKLSIWKTDKKAGKKRSLEDVLSQSEETFQTMLLRLIREKGMTNPQVYKKANLDKKLFSKIKKDVNYHPKKNTAVALALALELNLDQTKDLIGRAGFALSPSSKFDLAISYFIENGIYDLFTVEELLFSHDLGTLSNY